MNKYFVLLLLFAFIATAKLNKKTKCKMSGEKCRFNIECCGSRVCLSKQGNVCGSHLTKDQLCGEDGECASPYFCAGEKNKKVCTAPYPSGEKCKKDSQCQSGTCKGNLGGIKTGKCK